MDSSLLDSSKVGTGKKKIVVLTVTIVKGKSVIPPVESTSRCLASSKNVNCQQTYSSNIESCT